MVKNTTKLARREVLSRILTAAALFIEFGWNCSAVIGLSVVMGAIS